MTAVLAAIIPIVALLLLGKALSKTSVLSAEGWLGLESVTYYALFPALIIRELARADLSGVDWRMPVALVGAQIAIALGSFLVARVLRQPDNRIGVFIQSGVRWNTFIAFALAQDLMGPTGVALIAGAAAAMVPSANLMSILALIRFSHGRLDAGPLLKQIALNPLIIAFAIGLSINQFGIGLHASIESILKILAQAAIAIGLLATGSHMQLKGGGAPFRVTLGWSVLRLLALPLIAAAIAISLGVSPTMMMVILIATAVPTASNGAILARKLGGDAQLAANLIALQTVLAVLTVTGIFWAAEVLDLI